MSSNENSINKNESGDEFPRRKRFAYIIGIVLFFTLTIFLAYYDVGASAELSNAQRNMIEDDTDCIDVHRYEERMYAPFALTLDLDGTYAEKEILTSTANPEETDLFEDIETSRNAGHFGWSSESFDSFVFKVKLRYEFETPPDEPRIVNFVLRSNGDRVANDQFVNTGTTFCKFFVITAVEPPREKTEEEISREKEQWAVEAISGLILMTSDNADVTFLAFLGITASGLFIFLAIVSFIYKDRKRDEERKKDRKDYRESTTNLNNAVEASQSQSSMMELKFDEMGHNFTKKFNEMIAKGQEAIDISIKNLFHAKTAVEGTKAKQPVLCQKCYKTKTLCICFDGFKPQEPTLVEKVTKIVTEESIPRMEERKSAESIPIGPKLHDLDENYYIPPPAELDINPHEVPDKEKTSIKEKIITSPVGSISGIFTKVKDAGQTAKQKIKKEKPVEEEIPDELKWYQEYESRGDAELKRNFDELLAECQPSKEPLPEKRKRLEIVHKIRMERLKTE